MNPEEQQESRMPAALAIIPGAGEFVGALEEMGTNHYDGSPGNCFQKKVLRSACKMVLTRVPFNERGALDPRQATLNIHNNMLPIPIGDLELPEGTMVTLLPPDSMYFGAYVNYLSMRQQNQAEGEEENP